MHQPDDWHVTIGLLYVPDGPDPRRHFGERLRDLCVARVGSAKTLRSCSPDEAHIIDRLIRELLQDALALHPAGSWQHGGVHRAQSGARTALEDGVGPA